MMNALSGTDPGDPENGPVTLNMGFPAPGTTEPTEYAPADEPVPLDGKTMKGYTAEITPSALRLEQHKTKQVLLTALFFTSLPPFVAVYLGSVTRNTVDMCVFPGRAPHVSPDRG